jgi:hypothetical protein
MIELIALPDVDNSRFDMFINDVRKRDMYY